MIRNARARMAIPAAIGLAAIIATGGAVQAMSKTNRPAAPPVVTGLNFSSTGEAGFLPSGRMIQRLTAANMAGGFSGGQAAAVSLARAYDVIIATPSQFRSYMSAMRAANPHLTLLAYINGTFAQKGQSTAFPSSWYLHDAQGRRTTSAGYGNFAMDPANPGWVASRVQACAQMVSQGYDGCMLDMLGSSPTQAGYLSSIAINPATHQAYTASQWLTAASNLGAAVAHAVYPKLVAGNGLGSGSRYFDPSAPSSQLFTGIKTAIGEAWLRKPGSPASVYPTAAQWKQNVDAMVNAGEKGDSLVALTKTWGGGTAAQVSAWHLFSLASFLLGTNGAAYYEFSPANTAAGIMFDSPWEHINVGTPTSSYTHVGNVYERTFTLGFAVVNPTTSRASVTLPQPMCDVNGAHRTSVTLGPDGAGVFYHC